MNFHRHLLGNLWKNKRRITIDERVVEMPIFVPITEVIATDDRAQIHADIKDQKDLIRDLEVRLKEGKKFIFRKSSI